MRAGGTGAFEQSEMAIRIAAAWSSELVSTVFPF
jgi:hypothetical protein